QQATFKPGFGCKVGDAVQASCSAFPFFDRVHLKTSQGDDVELADGGFCANNPTMYAITDALRALRYAPENVRVISLGVGTYPEPKRPWYEGLVRRHWLVRLLQKTLDVNSGSMEQLRQILFKDVPTVRISET